MKEITIRVEDNIAEALTKDAHDRGLTILELVKSIIGEYVSTHLMLVDKLSSMMKTSLGELDDVFDRLEKKMLKMKASSGVLTCKNCTMRLTEKDVEDGKCSSCGALLKTALGENEENRR